MFSVLILNTDNSYEEQRRLLDRGKVLDLSGIPEKKYMASPETLKKIEKLLPENRNFISFLGQGDYHYITYLFLKKLRKKTTLVVLDNHIDNMTVMDSSFISCGSWINNALSLNHIEKVIVVSTNKEEKSYGKLRVLNYDSEISSKLQKEIKKSKNIYLSIDKDILSKDVLDTNWDQGDLKLDDVLRLIGILSNRYLTGVDVCGEPEPLNIFEIKKSEDINLRILKKVMERYVFAPAG